MAGGKSSRFGADKLTFPFRGELLVFGALSSLLDFPEVLLVTKYPHKFSHLERKFPNLRVIFEPFKEFSPIFGIYTGMRASRFDRILFVPGDLPLLKGEFISEFSREIPPAVLVEGERFHSLLFLISKFSLPIVEEFLKSGGHKLRELHQRLSSRLVPFEKFRHLDYRAVSLLNVNRKEDYIEAVCR